MNISEVSSSGTGSGASSTLAADWRSCVAGWPLRCATLSHPVSSGLWWKTDIAGASGVVATSAEAVPHKPKAKIAVLMFDKIFT